MMMGLTLCVNAGSERCSHPSEGAAVVTEPSDDAADLLKLIGRLGCLRCRPPAEGRSRVFRQRSQRRGLELDWDPCAADARTD